MTTLFKEFLKVLQMVRNKGGGEGLTVRPIIDATINACGYARRATSMDRRLVYQRRL